MAASVLLLDEPFGALDYVTRRQLQDVLLDLWEEPGRAVPTVVFVTHDVDEALTLADRIVAMRSGAIVDDIPVRAARPRDTDSLLLPDMVAIKHKLLGHLGLERRPAAWRMAEARHDPRSPAGARWPCPLAVFLALIVAVGDPVPRLHRGGAAWRADGRGLGHAVHAHVLSLSDYWQGGIGVPSVADGAARSYLAAILSLVSHSLATFVRLEAGSFSAASSASRSASRVSWSRWSRRLVQFRPVFARAAVARDGAVVPALVRHLFFGQVLFVAYGVGVIVFAGVVNAVRNVPQIYLDNARALGASRSQLYRTVVLPAILPAMRSVTLLSLGAGWGAVLAAEYLGAQSGLGYIIVYAQQFGLLDRMFLVALLFILYTSMSYWAIERLFARLLVWSPAEVAR